jgi:FkbM family methyltransferase
MDVFGTLRYARRYRNWREIRRARAAGGYPCAVVLRSGERFEAPGDVNPARITNGVYFKRVYTPRGLELPRGATVVDVGANIGVFSVFAARGGAGAVIAVEPFAKNAEYLERNLELNGCAGVRVVRGALADRDGAVRLYLGDRGVTHGLFAIHGETTTPPSVEVEAWTLRTLMDRLGVDRIGLLKMDCEGSEGLVLRSAPGGLLERIDRVAMEFHDDLSPLGHGELARRLEAAGLRTWLRWDGRSATGFLYGVRH